MSRKRLLAALALAAITAALVPVSPARAATTYQVQVGAEAGPAFSWRFYPSAIKVAKGDTLQFNSMVDLTPAGESAEEWREKYSSDVDQQYYLWQSDSDDDSEKINLNVLWEFVGPPCGTADAPCSYTGEEIHNGLPFFSDDPGFAVVVDATPGTVFYAVNLFGGQSHMRIEVVDNPAEASTQAELDQRSAELQERDTALAGALWKSLNNPEKHKEGGRVVWDAYAGYDTRNLSFFDNFPKKLTVKKGQKVRYHFELENEYHSATFGNKAFEVFSESFLPVCDPDGDAGTAPDTEALPEPPFCEDPTQLEADMHKNFFGQAGNGSLTGGTDFESSGVRSPESLQGGGFGDGKYWDVTMKKANMKRGFKFICLLHGPGMNNKVFVKP